MSYTLFLNRIRYEIPSPRLCSLALVALGLSLVFLASSPARAMEKGTFEPPELTRFLLINTEEADGDGDGIKETRILHYQDVAGDKLFSMTTKGQLWAWSLETPGEKQVVSGWNYVIRDSNCDGVFDEKYSLDEDFHVPECLK